MSIGPPISEMWLFQNLTMKSHGQVHACGQRSRLLCCLSNQSIYFFLPYQTTLLFPKYSYLKICPWKSKVKVMIYYLFDSENSRSRSWPRSIPFITFEAKSSIDMFAFSFVTNGPVHIRPWKFKVKIVVKTLFVTTRETWAHPAWTSSLAPPKAFFTKML